MTEMNLLQKFLKLSDIDILRILRENDRISIPTISYQCSIRFLINELISYNKKHQEQENKIVKNLGIVKKDIGLSNYLVGQDIKLDDLFYTLDKYPSLHISSTPQNQSATIPKHSL